MLSTRILTQFVAVAEELHFGRAAARLHMAQSPLSQAIQRLEAHLGVPLFVRTRRSVALTVAGEVFLQRARAMLAAEHAAVASARRAHEVGSGRLAVAFVGTVAYGIVPRILHDFRAGHPTIELVIHEMTTRDQLDALQTGAIDVGIVRRPLPLPRVEGLASRVIERDRFALALPAAHALARRPFVHLREVSGSPFVAYSHDRVPLIHSQGLAACLDAGFNPNIVCEAWQASSILSLVAAGLGVALVPSHLSSMRHEGVAIVPLDPGTRHLGLEIVALWRVGDSAPGVAAFVAGLPKQPRRSPAATRADPRSNRSGHRIR